MAKTNGVWGIDIGRSAIKALRCRMDGDALVADGFDYIEYPKLLSQPDADPNQLIKEALEQFLSRNDLRGDKVAISVSGESGLARYFKPPPVDIKKIADIVKYEAKQQIPFALEDVIWDYQRMPGGQETDGFALDTEIGLFAMKREQVAKALAPYNAAMIEVDYIQLAPIALYNYVAYDITKDLPPGEDYNSESPPPSTVVLAIGTETTDLVVTNGYRLWQRNIPLGGSHFTKQLSKDLKLTFAKAEHLKRNPKQAEDPKAIFQAMRPVFGDMVTEVQRSIRHFQNLDRKASINRVVLLGNTGKLPGLQQYLSKHLGYEVELIESFNRLSGASVVTSPSFKDNVPAFGNCYGLCLQGLGKSKISTNLLPREIYTQRLVKAKKPWALAAVAALMLGLALNYILHYRVWNEVNEDFAKNGVTWEEAVRKADEVNKLSATLLTADKERVEKLEMLQKVGHEVVGTADRRVLWLELMKAINNALPPTDESLAPGQVPDPKTLDFSKRKDLKIEYIESQYFPATGDPPIGDQPATWVGGLDLWFTDEVKRKYLEANPHLAAAAMDGDSDAAAAPAIPAVPAPSTGMPGMESGYGGYPGGPGGQMAPVGIDVSGVNIPGPQGPGWVIEIRGYHFYNSSDPKERHNTGPAHVRNTLMNFLENGSIELPLGPGLPNERFTLDELGIGYVILAWDPPINRNFTLPNPNYVPPTSGPGSGSFGGESPMPFPMATGAAGAAGAAADPNAEPPEFKVPKYEFIVQFCWQEKPLSIRLAEREKRKAEAKLAAENGGVLPGTNAPPEPVPGPASVPGPGAQPPAGAPAAPANEADPAAAPANGPVPPAGAAPAVAPENGAVPPAGAAAPAAGAGAVPQPNAAGPAGAVAPGPGVAPGAPPAQPGAAPPGALPAAGAPPAGAGAPGPAVAPGPAPGVAPGAAAPGAVPPGPAAPPVLPIDEAP